MKHGLIKVNPAAPAPASAPPCRPVARPAVDRDGRAVPVGDPLHEAQAEARAFGSGGPRRVTPEEPLEHVRHGAGRDADAGVVHLQHRVDALTLDPDADPAARRRELDGVVQQVQQQPLQPARVAQDVTGAGASTVSVTPFACATGSS